ncbi:KPN_02809 family neutral zinc metallopeptidase [Rhodobium gokarnense]|uniref:Metalloprotease n=1 Tax=Rhodobium gokarnense TaxID=364296 RepID=A0ABT3H5Z9_9HYPH|nr:neutral zinc metallopeptidase [Rhodobium gokarnense]MCW2305817.1 putative metalloprotease [Rhodobium gokarnense]
MRWRGRRQSSNIDDRRGGRVVRRAGGGSILFVLIAIGASLLFGIDPRQVLGILEGGQTVSQQRQTAPAGGRNDEGRAFVSVVLADTEDVWNRVFAANDLKYEEPTLVLFSGRARSACGFASAASGPFYCPGDRQVYIDLAFYEELRRRFKAPGDFAQAYVIAHEVGHHVQNLTGVLPEFNRRRQTLSEREANQLSVRVELQADCYAGVWAHFTQQKGLLEAGDIEEALNAAHQIGDDAIQKRTQGYVVPDAFNHGTSEQRARWFRRGLSSGKVSDCDTFSGRRV